MLVVSCATWEGKRYAKRPHARKPAAAAHEKKGEGRKDVIVPEDNKYASISTPARTASANMVNKGKALLDAGDYEKAVSMFQEAVIIDAGNGIAYYYMAKARYYLNERDAALGILEKAESLLSGTPEWKDAIALLKLQIETSELSSDDAKDSGLIPIINRRD
jgi:tetratricopeptide (TPR) repeat protein